VFVRKLCLTIVAVGATLLWRRTAQAQTARYLDNGDGTISDTTTGLMWEKKTGTVGEREDRTDAHNVNNTYRRSETDDGDRPDGAAFTKFLFQLNHETSANGIDLAGCFANHCDWRLPSIDELKGIVDSDTENPSIDPIFGPTQSQRYWSATTDDGFPHAAWRVHFADGNVQIVGKRFALFVRAVPTSP
jgi:Protein of unknown function (DUF1566)